LRSGTVVHLMAIALKQCFPFRLAAPSYIFPAGYGANVQRLSPLLDEIELLFLERDHLPSADEIRELQDLAEGTDITYNIHLPMDISLAHSSQDIRDRSIEAVREAITLAVPLNPTSHTLHLTFQEIDHQPATVQAWQQRAIESLALLLQKAPLPASSLCLETLDFPPLWLTAVAEELNLSVCVDVGHHLQHGYDLRETIARFSQRIGIFHLHGVCSGRDHCALDQLPAEVRSWLADRLKTFHGSVSLEVFSYPALTVSLACFKEMMDRVLTG
jgi:sugar phosphate isomerase/epimerase